MVISHLKGTISNICDNSMVIDVNGVGYHIFCSSRTINLADNISGLVHIYTELDIREDAWVMYGFISEQERTWFNILTSVQGVGGKAALAILSAISDEEIYNAFLAGDKDVFTRADGIGPKLASRIIAELKDRVIGKMEVNNQVQSQVVHSSSVVNDVMSALMNLGYQKSDIYRIISSVQITQDTAFEELLKNVLNKLSSGV